MKGKEPFLYFIFTLLILSFIWLIAYIFPSKTAFSHDSLFTTRTLIFIILIPFLIAFSPAIYRDISSKLSPKTRETEKSKEPGELGFFRFLKGFKEDDREKGYFLGRDEVINTLFHHLTAANLKIKFYIITSYPGFGKSSLINAGLIPVLKEKPGYLPVVIHGLTGKSEDINIPVKIRDAVFDSDKSLKYTTDCTDYSKLKNYLESIVDDKSSEELDQLPPGLEFPSEISGKMRCDAGKKLQTFIGGMTESEKNKLLELSEDTKYREAVVKLFQKSQDKNKKYKTIVLIFDQFEEFFIRYGYEDRQDFIKNFVNQMIKTSDRMQFIFSIRHDWFVNMDEFRGDRVAEPLTAHYLFLHGLPKNYAEEIVKKSGEFEGRRGLVAVALDSLSEKEQTISPAEFQLVFSSLLNKERYPNEKYYVSKRGDLKEAKENIISDYVQEQIAEGEIWFRILRSLVGPDEKRLELRLEEIMKISGIKKEEAKEAEEAEKAKKILATFEASCMVRKDVREPESETTYRLMHDYLVPKILNISKYPEVEKSVREYQIKYLSKKGTEKDQEEDKYKGVVSWGLIFVLETLFWTTVLEGGVGKPLYPDLVKWQIDFSFIPHAVAAGSLAYFAYIYYERILSLPLLRELDLENSRRTARLHIPAYWVPIWAYILALFSLLSREWAFCLASLGFLVATLKNLQLNRTFETHELKIRFAAFVTGCIMSMGALLGLGLFFGLLFKYGLSTDKHGSNIIIETGTVIFSYFGLGLEPKVVEQSVYLSIYLMAAIFICFVVIIFQKRVANDTYDYELKGLLIKEDRRSRSSEGNELEN